MNTYFKKTSYPVNYSLDFRKQIKYDVPKIKNQNTDTDRGGTDGIH